MERLDASIRRQLLKDDEAFIGQPIEIFGPNIGRTVQANTRHLALMLLDSAVKDRASRAAAFMENLADISSHKHVTAPVACGKGCSHCCTTYVSTTLPEVFNLARALRGKEAVTARIKEAALRSRSMPQLQREVTRVICPILENHACSEYLSRPVICRAVMSLSLETCQRIFVQGVGAPFTPPPNLDSVRAFLVVMMRAALMLAGLPHQNFELTHALETALAAEDTEERWLNGEPVFAAVAVDQADQAQSKLNTIVGGLVEAVRPTI